MLAGIFAPTLGEVKIDGKVTPLFNMMEGLAADASGLENIYIRGYLLGLNSDQIENTISEIIEFSELGEFINLPVRVYSTGMLVRLMFAISTAVTPEILVMDEFIGAGDAKFLLKAHNRLMSFVKNTKVLVVATHAPDVVENWCDKVMYIEKGEIKDFGSKKIATDYFSKYS